MKMSDRYGENADLLGGPVDTYVKEVNEMRRVGSPPGQAAAPGSIRHDPAYVDQ